MKAPKSNITRTIAPAGTHIARVIGLIYIGTIETEFKGEKKSLYKVRITWELPNKTHEFRPGEGQKPFTVSKEYTFSMGKKSNLRPVVEGIIGTSLTDEEAFGFDLNTIIGLPCLISLTHDEGETGKYVVINGTSQLLEGVVCPPQVNETKVLEYGTNWNQAYFDSLPDFIKDKIKSSKEYGLKMDLDGMRKKAPEQVDSETINPNDIPF